MIVLGYALAALIGLSLGLMGGGGSILTVPIFVYVLGFDPKLAIAMSLPVVGITSLVGALGHWRAGNVRLRTALLFGAIAMVGAFAGARLAVFVSGVFQLSLLAVVMLAAAISMFRSARRSGTGASAENDERPMALPLLIPVAMGVGLLTGLVGIGGGFLVVPALVLLGRVPMKKAVGTSLLVIAMNSAAGFAGYLGTVQVPWGFMAGFTAVAIAGILGGTALVRFVSQRALKQAFAVFLLVMGTFILYKNRNTFGGTTAPVTQRTH
ncbi:sulfite exporter TauE/SafE family protein [soil metagenome]